MTALKAIGDRLWPRGPTYHDIDPIDEGTKRSVLQLEQQMRAELTRAQTEALRLRTLQERRG
jgi:hypothetical protein